MPLDPAQLEVLKTYLNASEVFKQHIATLSDKPFRPLDTDVLSRLEEATRMRRRWWLIAFLGFLALGFALLGWWLNPYSPSPPLLEVALQLLPDALSKEVEFNS